MKTGLVYAFVFSLVVLASFFALPFDASRADTLSDAYEPDDSYSLANSILLYSQNAAHMSLEDYAWNQQHNFHETEDQDWVKYYCLAGNTYTIEVTSAGADCDAVIELYKPDGATLIKQSDDYPAGHDEQLEFQCDTDGTYYFLIYDYYGTSGDQTDYTLSFYEPIAAAPGMLLGFITNSFGMGIDDVILTTDGNGSAISLKDGSYFMPHSAGTFNLTLTAQGYPTYEQSVQISENEVTELNITLSADQTANQSITASFSNPLGIGDTLTLSASALAAEGQTLYYRFGYKSKFNTAQYTSAPWQMLQDWSTDSTLTTSFSETGSFIWTVDVADSPSPSESLCMMGGVVNVGDISQPVLTGFDVVYAGTSLAAGESVTFSATSVSSTGETSYYLFGYKPNFNTDAYATSSWVMLQDWSTSSTCTTSFNQAGTYIITVDVSGNAGYPTSGLLQLMGGSLTVE